MRFENLELEIIKGIARGERPADALYLCHSAAIMLLAEGKDMNALEEEIIRWTVGPDGNPHLIEFGYFGDNGIPNPYKRLLRGAATILCPIFEYIKHRKYSRYAENMSRTRLSYRGIASSAELKADYNGKLLWAISKGAFETLQNADMLNLPELLRSSAGTLGSEPLAYD